MLVSTERPDMLSRHEYYLLLMYELFSGFRVRYGQLKLFESFLAPGEKRFIAELKPGAGKTSILPVIAVLERLKGNNVILELPQALYSVQSAQIENMLRRFGVECYHLRSLNIQSRRYLSQLNRELEHAKQQGKVILSTVSEVQALRLQAGLLSKQNANAVKTLLDFLEDTMYIVDEVDQELSPTRVVNIPIGEKQSTPKDLQVLVANVMQYASRVAPELNSAVLEKGYHGAQPQDVSLTPAALEDFIKALLDSLPSELSRLQVESFVRAYHQVMFLSINNYAQSPNHQYEAVPAIGGIAIPGTKFSDPVTKLITAWLVADQKGMDRERLRELVLNRARCIISDNRYGVTKATRQDWFATTFDADQLTRAPSDVVNRLKAIYEKSGQVQSVEDEALDQVTDLILELSHFVDAEKINAAVFCEYVKTAVFPAITVHLEKVSLGPLDHYRKNLVGLTGTTLAYQGLAKYEGEMYLQGNVIPRLSGDGSTLNYLEELEALGNLSFVSFQDFKLSPDKWGGQYSALIDHAKLVNPIDTEQYIQKLFKDIPEDWNIQCILFFKDNDFYGL